MSDKKTNNGNETDNLVKNNGFDDMNDGISLDKLRKKYNVAEVEENVDAPPAEESQSEEADELPVRKKFFGTLKRKNRQSEQEVSVSDAGDTEQKTDDPAIAKNEDIPDKLFLQDTEEGISKSTGGDTGFDAFPSFLHISDSDIPEPRLNSKGMDMVLAELVELESGIPSEIQVQNSDVPELLFENEKQETVEKKPLDVHAETCEPDAVEKKSSAPSTEDDAVEVSEDKTEQEEPEPQTESGNTDDSLEDVHQVFEVASGDMESVKEETSAPLNESSAAVSFLDDIRKIFAASSAEANISSDEPADGEVSETSSGTDITKDETNEPEPKSQPTVIPDSNPAPVSETIIPPVSPQAGTDSLTPSLRIVYQAPDGKNPGFSAVHGNFTQPVPVVYSPSSDQNPAEKDTTPAVTVTDFLANMRIVYEAPEEIFNEPETPEETEKSVADDTTESEKLPKIDAVPDEINHSGEEIQEKPCDIDAEQSEQTAHEQIIKTTEIAGSSAAGLADLFDAANEGPDVSKIKKSFKQKLRSVFPQKGDGIAEIIRKTVLIISVLTMIVCGVILFDNYVVSPYLNSKQSKDAVDVKTNSSHIKDWSTAKDKYANINFPTGMQLKYAELYYINRDFAGWLEIPGIGINMPIVQGSNNLDYLKKSFYNKSSKFGCCFVDHFNNIKELDRNTVIYGHNTRYGSNAMFVPLEKLRTVDGFKKDPLIEFDTLYANHKWKIYAVFVTNAEKTGDNGFVFNYIFKDLSSDKIFGAYIKQLDQRKLYTTGVDLLPTDKILTLSTCTYDFDDARLVVVARMVRPGESEDVNTALATVNTSPRYPQAWYSAKGQTNPYSNADKWYPS